MELLQKYFPDLQEQQLDQFRMLQDLYAEWNQKINVLSRKDIDHLYERHVLHALAIARFHHFHDHSQILDVGTGGGFPGIPLAIFFPNCQFTLVDSIAKKIKVVSEVSQALGLQNTIPINARAESLPKKYHFVVSRAVTAMPVFYGWVKNSFRKDQTSTLKNGIIALKGGDLQEELKLFQKRIQLIDLKSYFEEEFFVTKKIVYLPVH